MVVPPSSCRRPFAEEMKGPSGCRRRLEHDNVPEEGLVATVLTLLVFLNTIVMVPSGSSLFKLAAELVVVVIEDGRPGQGAVPRSSWYRIRYIFSSNHKGFKSSRLDSYTKLGVVSVWFQTVPHEALVSGKLYRTFSVVGVRFPSGPYGSVYGPNVPDDGHLGSR
jgi:hypothetical protein